MHHHAPLLAPPYATAPTVTIDLGAIAANYRYLKQRVAPAECAAVVKTNAYGLGLEPVADALAKADCSSFFIANAENGGHLRRQLPDATIFVFHGVASKEEAAFAAEYQLTPVVNTRRQLAFWQAEAKRRGHALPAALQVDTGITRLGFDEAEAKLLAEDAAALDGVDVVLIMNHLGCSFEEDHPLTQRQIREFEVMKQWFPQARRSLVNSAGLFFKAGCCGDLVRPGGALYGLNPSTAEPEVPMKCGVKLEAPILQIRTLSQDETVGYAASYHAKKGDRLATLAIGYADGLIHAATNCGHVWVAGHTAPIVGKVSMDLTTIDISALPEDAVQEGDLVEIYGPNRSFQDLANEAGTASYELFTSLGPRVHRQYINKPTA